MANSHAKFWPPSSAKRWLHCPYSSRILAMYERQETDQSLKGDYWHELMEGKVRFGCIPLSADPDAADAMDDLYAYIVKRVADMGGPGKVRILIEQQMLVPETGEIGTVDIALVGEHEYEIIDEKSGYVPVDVERNPQLGLYMLAIIGEYGPRGKYTISLHQPNYDHINGTLRSYIMTEQDIADLRQQVAHATGTGRDTLQAGPHCKETYCDHRGACDAFHKYVDTELSRGWHTGEMKAVDDDTLAKALDNVDQLTGWRNELRSEAMRRIMNMNRKVHGYKVVKGRKSRSVINPLKLVTAVCTDMGVEWACKLFPEFDWATDAIRDRLTVGDYLPILKGLGTPKHIEDIIKLYAKQHGLKRGAWKDLYTNVVGEYIRDTDSGLTLERAIDGRPAHSRGSELGGLLPAPTSNVVKMI